MPRSRTTPRGEITRISTIKNPALFRSLAIRLLYIAIRVYSRRLALFDAVPARRTRKKGDPYRFALDKFWLLCYNIPCPSGQGYHHTVDGSLSRSSLTEGFFSLRSCERRGMHMEYITLSDLLQFTLVLLSLATFILTFCNIGKKK